MFFHKYNYRTLSLLKMLICVLVKKLKSGKETQVIKILSDYDIGESAEVVTKKAFGSASTVFEKGDYVLVYNLRLDDSISLYRKGE